MFFSWSPFLLISTMTIFTVQMGMIFTPLMTMSWFIILPKSILIARRHMLFPIFLLMMMFSIPMMFWSIWWSSILYLVTYSKICWISFHFQRLKLIVFLYIINVGYFIGFFQWCFKHLFLMVKSLILLFSLLITRERVILMSGLKIRVISSKLRLELRHIYLLFLTLILCRGLKTRRFKVSLCNWSMWKLWVPFRHPQNYRVQNFKF